MVINTTDKETGQPEKPYQQVASLPTLTTKQHIKVWVVTGLVAILSLVGFAYVGMFLGLFLHSTAGGCFMSFAGSYCGRLDGWYYPTLISLVIGMLALYIFSVRMFYIKQKNRYTNYH